jgi:glycosyltransferase involved in cell wall biosynthesis
MLDVVIIIPAHNEEKFIKKTLNSLLGQTYLPARIIVVDDHSTDRTADIVQELAERHSIINLINRRSKANSLPGAKVINAFYDGIATVEGHYDVICKFDADLVFPVNYLRTLVDAFQQEVDLGMIGGVCTIYQNDTWKVEGLTNLDHIRGAIKAYRRPCFEQIGGLKRAMGWDTIDELLARYHGWQVKVKKELKVKHLKPTGKIYSRKLPLQFGVSVFKMRYGFFIGLLAISKLAFRKKSLYFLILGYLGFLKALMLGESKLVTKDEGLFIRQYRMRNIKRRFLLT